MSEISYIKEKGEYYKNTYHGQRVKEQLTDLSFYKDDFKVPLLKKPALKQRTGEASKLIDIPAGYIITSNPQFFRHARRTTEIDKAVKIGKWGNFTLQQLKKQTPNPINEHGKTVLLSGEGWIQVVPNEGWTFENQEGMPVWFRTPDPITVFASPKEYFGVPEEVFIICKKDYEDIQYNFPTWNNPKGKNGGSREVDFLGYWSKDLRYFEADEESLLKDGIQENMLGFVNFVHCYTGFGKGSPEGRPEDLVVGRLRNVRGILEEECALASDIMSLVHRHAYPTREYERQPNAVVADDALDDLDMSPDSVIITPEGLKRVESQDFLKSLPALLQQLAIVRARLHRELPALLEGMMGGSGRQDDFATIRALRQYDSVVENVESSWSTAFGMALRVLDKLDYMLPITVYGAVEEGVRAEEEITKKDIAGYYECEIKLKASDSMEKDRKAMMIRQAWIDGLFDTKTTLVEGYDKIPEEADRIMKERMKDNATILFPPWNMLMGMQYANDRGMGDLFAQLASQGQSPVQSRPSEVKTAQGRNELDMSQRKVGVRNPPMGV